MKAELIGDYIGMYHAGTYIFSSGIIVSMDSSLTIGSCCPIQLFYEGDMRNGLCCEQIEYQQN
jgi:hypothetical protein